MYSHMKPSHSGFTGLIFKTFNKLSVLHLCYILLCLPSLPSVYWFFLTPFFWTNPGHRNQEPGWHVCSNAGARLMTANSTRRYKTNVMKTRVTQVLHKDPAPQIHNTYTAPYQCQINSSINLADEWVGWRHSVFPRVQSMTFINLALWLQQVGTCCRTFDYGDREKR